MTETNDTMPLEEATNNTEPPIRIGVSSCLLGHMVRYDGGHKRDVFLLNVLGDYVEWVSVCPEVEIGLGIPRPTLRLERGEEEDVRMVMPKTGEDLTDRMRDYAKAKVADLARLDLCGYVLKKDSPSCGLMRVKIYNEHNMAKRDGRGLYAEELVKRFPILPIEEEGRLNDNWLRENFIERVFAYHRLKQLFQRDWTMGDLVQFHTVHKFQLLAHEEEGYREMGRLVARGKKEDREVLREQYETLFMETLRKMATVKRNVNVLQHMLGFLKDKLDDASRHELLGIITDYHKMLVPLVVPLTLMRHHVYRHDVNYLKGQTYLEPHPKELMLRNHV